MFTGRGVHRVPLRKAHRDDQTVTPYKQNYECTRMCRDKATANTNTEKDESGS